MRRNRPFRLFLAAAGTIATGILVAEAQQDAGWAPQWTGNNELKLPRGYREWIYLGSPTTPNGLNNSEAGFPEFHNVYIPKEVFDAFNSTGEYPEGSIFVKELQLAMQGTYPDGSRDESSGRGYFPGAFNGMDVMVKDSKRCAATDNWCFFNFGHHAEPYEPVAAILPQEKCAGCHQANADKNLHFTRFYQLLLPASQ